MMLKGGRVLGSVVVVVVVVVVVTGASVVVEMGLCVVEVVVSGASVLGNEVGMKPIKFLDEVVVSSAFFAVTGLTVGTKEKVGFCFWGG